MRHNGKTKDTNVIEDKKIESIKESDKTSGIDVISKLLIDKFYTELLSENDKKLLNLMFSETTTQKDLDEFLQEWDIEVEGSHKTLMLSYFMKMHPDLKFTDYVLPRLKGLFDFYKFKNIKLFSHFTKICNVLTKENIKILLLKGGAMKYLRPELSRVMGDLDILVPEKQYLKAGKLAESMGYDAAWAIHSVDLHLKNSQEGIVDIHKYIQMMTGCEKKINNDLFDRAQKAKVYNVEVLVPCHEDMFFIALVNMARNLSDNTSTSGILYTLFDCKFLLDSKPDFDWSIVITNAVKTKTQLQISFAIKFINQIIPGLLPDEIQKNEIFEKSFTNYSVLVFYNRFFLCDMQMQNRSLKLYEALKNRKIFVEYLKLKSTYFLLKRKIIRKNPYFAKLVLNIYEKLKMQVNNENR